MKINNIAILGTGAVGAAIAHQLTEAGAHAFLTIIAEGERAERYQRNGFRVNGDTIRPAVAADGMFDLIILAVKSYHLEKALPVLDRCMSRNTVVMSLLNGITSEAILGERYGHHRVIPAMILGIDALRDESGIRYLNRGKIYFGANPETEAQNQQIEALLKWFDRVGLGYVLSPDITRTLWHKFMINVGINQASAVLGAPYGRFQQDGEARELMLGAVREVVALSELEETGLTDEDIGEWLGILETLDPTGRTSMLQDADAGRRMEVDLFADAVISRARKHKMDVPVNMKLQKQLTARQPEQQN